MDTAEVGSEAQRRTYIQGKYSVEEKMSYDILCHMQMECLRDWIV